MHLRDNCPIQISCVTNLGDVRKTLGKSRNVEYRTFLINASLLTTAKSVAQAFGLIVTNDCLLAQTSVGLCHLFAFVKMCSFTTP